MVGFLRTLTASLSAPTVALFLGTIFATAGWGGTYIMNNVVSVPTIEYDIELSKHTDGRIAVTIRNLSRTHKFSGLNFILRLPVEDPGEFIDAKVEAIQPAYAAREMIKVDNASVTYPSQALHPGTALKLIASYDKAVKTPTFHIAENGDAVRLVESGTLTWIIRNEIKVLVVLFIVWTLIVLVVLGKLARGRRDHETG